MSLTLTIGRNLSKGEKSNVRSAKSRRYFFDTAGFLGKRLNIHHTLPFGQKSGCGARHSRNSLTFFHLLACFWTKRWMRYTSFKKFIDVLPPFGSFLGKKVDVAHVIQEIH